SSPGMKVGYVATDAAYARMVTRECGLYVSASLFWELIAPTPTATNFSSAESADAWARAHGMSFRGVPLVWHYRTPSWFKALPNRAAMIQALRAHIHGTCAHFAGRVHSWDVVNEAILTKGGINGLRKNVFLDKIGPEYLDIAFRTAREADPRALLVLNENYL